MITTPPLKPCPFCGCAAEIRSVKTWFGAGCDTLRQGVMCPGLLTALQHRSEQSAAEAWNRRTASARPQATSPEQIDTHLDAVLRAAGSGLRHYTMQKSLDDMRAAMRKAITGDPT